LNMMKMCPTFASRAASTTAIACMPKARRMTPAMAPIGRARCATWPMKANMPGRSDHPGGISHDRCRRRATRFLTSPTNLRWLPQKRRPGRPLRHGRVGATRLPISSPSAGLQRCSSRRRGLGLGRLAGFLGLLALDLNQLLLQLPIDAFEP